MGKDETMAQSDSAKYVLSFAAKAELRELQNLIKELGRLKGVSHDIMSAMSTMRQSTEAISSSNIKNAKTVNAISEAYMQLRKSLKEQEEQFKKVVSAGSIDIIVSKLRGIGSELKTLSTYLTTFLAYRGLTVFNQMNSSLADYEHWLKLTTSIIDDSTFSYDKLDKIVTKVATTFGIDFREAAESLYFAVSSGIKASQLEDFMMNTALASKTSAAGFSETSKLLASLINTFGDTGETLNSITDKLFAAMKVGVFTMHELNMELGHVTALGKVAGVSLADILATLAGLTRIGMRSSIAVTAIRSAIAQLIKPNTELLDLINKLRVQFEGFDNLPLYEKFVKIGEAVGFNEEALSRLFPNVRGLNAVLAAIADKSNVFKETTLELANATGAASNAFKAIDNDLRMLMDKTGAEFYALLKDMAAIYLPAFVKWLQETVVWLKEVREKGDLKRVGESFNDLISLITRFLGLVMKLAVEYPDMAKWAVLAWTFRKSLGGVYEMLMKLNAAVAGLKIITVFTNAAVAVGTLKTALAGLVGWLMSLPGFILTGIAAIAGLAAYSEKQIQELEAGDYVRNISQRHALAKQFFYQWDMERAKTGRKRIFDDKFFDNFMKDPEKYIEEGIRKIDEWDWNKNTRESLEEFIQEAMNIYAIRERKQQELEKRLQREAEIQQELITLQSQEAKVSQELSIVRSKLNSLSQQEISLKKQIAQMEKDIVKAQEQYIMNVRERDLQRTKDIATERMKIWQDEKVKYEKFLDDRLKAIEEAKKKELDLEKDLEQKKKSFKWTKEREFKKELRERAKLEERQQSLLERLSKRVEQKLARKVKLRPEEEFIADIVRTQQELEKARKNRQLLQKQFLVEKGVIGGKIEVLDKWINRANEIIKNVTKEELQIKMVKEQEQMRSAQEAIRDKIDRMRELMENMNNTITEQLELVKISEQMNANLEEIRKKIENLGTLGVPE